MKSYFLLFLVAIFAFSCTFSKYGFPYKTKVSTEKKDNIINILIDSEELFGTNYFFETQVLDEYGEPGELILVTDSIQALMIEKFSNYFTKDLEFYYHNKIVEIDSVSYLVLNQDSSVVINEKLSQYDKNYSRIGAHVVVESIISREPEFKRDYYIIEDLIIYSGTKIFRFKNYFIWI